LSEIANGRTKSSPGHDAEKLESRRHLSAVAVGDHQLVDVEDAAVRAYVERPPRGSGPAAGKHSVGAGDLLACIAQDWMRQIQLLGNLAVALDGIDAGLEEGDVEVAKRVVALTERLAFRSIGNEDAGEPRQHDGADSDVIRETVHLAVGSGQGEVGCEISRLQDGVVLIGAGQKRCRTKADPQREQEPHCPPPSDGAHNRRRHVLNDNS
jgi:hypothetical protein